MGPDRDRTHDPWTCNRAPLPIALLSKCSPQSVNCVRNCIYLYSYQALIVPLCFVKHTIERYYTISNWLLFQFLLVMKYLSEMTEEQTLVLCSGHPQGLFPSSPDSPRAIITNGMVWTRNFDIFFN